MILWLCFFVGLIVVEVFGYACCAIAGHADDRAMSEYRRERDAFEKLFEQ